jgi:hypothetical protein
MPAPTAAQAPAPGPEAELALAAPYQRATPPPVPLPGGSPGWPPEQPAFGSDWTGPALDFGPPRARFRLAVAALVTLGVAALAAALAIAVL